VLAVPLRRTRLTTRNSSSFSLFQEGRQLCVRGLCNEGLRNKGLHANHRAWRRRHR
jgi:hypothetical protein